MARAFGGSVRLKDCFGGRSPWELGPDIFFGGLPLRYFFHSADRMGRGSQPSTEQVARGR